MQRDNCMHRSVPFYIVDLSIHDFGTHRCPEAKPQGYQGTTLTFWRVKLLGTQCPRCSYSHLYYLECIIPLTEFCKYIVLGFVSSNDNSNIIYYFILLPCKTELRYNETVNNS